MSGRDVFVVLPTGHGKSFCYGSVPRVFDKLKRVDKKPIVIVVSPLIALMKDQVRSFQAKRIPSVCVTADTESNQHEKNCVLSVMYQLLLISSELLLTKHCYRLMCRSPEYIERLVTLVIDEAHCVKKW